MSPNTLLRLAAEAAKRSLFGRLIDFNVIRRGRLDIMTLKSISLPKSERFAASAASLRSVFGDIDQLSAYRGFLGKTFSFDSRCSKRPKLVGPVVASIQVSRSRTALLQLFPVKVREYFDAAAAHFAEKVLADLRASLTSQL